MLLSILYKLIMQLLFRQDFIKHTSLIVYVEIMNPSGHAEERKGTYRSIAPPNQICVDRYHAFVRGLEHIQ